MMVVDSFALIAYFQGEPAAREVRQVLRRAERGRLQILLSLINFGECIYIIERREGLEAAQEATLVVDALPIVVIPPDRKMVFEAAHLKARYPISYADAFAAALAKHHRARLMTGDPEFKAVEPEITIHWLPAR